MSDDKVKQAEKDIDLVDLAFALSQLAKKVITGKEVETEEFTVQLHVPKEVVVVLKMTSQAHGVPLEALLSNLASRGLDISLQLDLNAAKKHYQEQQQQVTPTPQPTGGLPPELAGIFNGGVVSVPSDNQLGQTLQGLQQVMSQLGPLKDLAQQLGDIQKVVENVDSATDKKDSK